MYPPVVLDQGLGGRVPAAGLKYIAESSKRTRPAATPDSPRIDDRQPVATQPHPVSVSGHHLGPRREKSWRFSEAPRNVTPHG